MATKSIVPRANGEGGIGTAAKNWLTSYIRTMYADHVEEVTSAHGVVLDGVQLKDGGALAIVGGTNTFNITNGTASLDVAAGAAVNIDNDLTVTADVTIDHGLPNRNAIINGGMDIWQRGTATLTNPATATYFPDRFSSFHSLGDGTYNLLQSAETPVVGFPFQNSLKLDCTHIETTVAAGEWCGFWYRVEGYDFKRFEGEIATLSFWVKAVKTGVHCVTFSNSALNKSYVHEFTINSASTWEKKTVTLTFNSGGTFLYTNGTGLNIFWLIECGSTYQIATANKDTWQAGCYFATDAQVNGLDSTDNNFWLTGVQLELGSVATPFEVRPFAQELALCQRYYYEPDLNSRRVYSGRAETVSACVVSLWLPVTMRATPTASVTTIANLLINDGSVQVACNAIVDSSYSNLNIATFGLTSAATTLTNNRSVFIIGSAPSGNIKLTAEL